MVTETMNLIDILNEEIQKLTNESAENDRLVMALGHDLDRCLTHIHAARLLIKTASLVNFTHGERNTVMKILDKMLEMPVPRDLAADEIPF